ncbi:MAG: leucine-rich repeat protein [Paludibacteraceae bacterium]|nr:leucine-rich repeat protein [Paludibacteraceae bacterium]
MKKLYCVITILCVTLTASAYDFTALDVNGNTIYYTKIGGDSVEVAYKGLKAYSGNVIVPETVYDGSDIYRVTAIGEKAFQECSTLQTITLPNSIKSIGYYAFAWCSALKSIEFPEGLTTIGKEAFYYCNHIESISFSKTVETIGSFAFRRCSAVTKISVAEGNPKYDSRNNCNALIETATNKLILGCSKTTIPNDIKRIDDYAFIECWELTFITIPSSVTSIGQGAFHDCYKVTSISLSEGLETIENSVFSGCKISSVNLPSTVTSLGALSFGNCRQLESLYFSENIKSIANTAFRNCPKLTSIEVAINNPSYDSRNNCNALIETATNKLILGCKSSTIPATVTAIDTYAFEQSELVSVSIPNGVTSIGSNAFYSCPYLANIIVEEGNPKYDSRNNCNALIETATNTLLLGSSNATHIPNGITTIADGAYYYRSELPYVSIPKTVTKIGKQAFWLCNKMDTMICWATTPPTLGKDLLSKQTILCVPHDYIDEYKAISDYTNYFTEIIGFSEVTDTTATTATIRWLAASEVQRYTFSIYTSDTLYAQYIVDGEGNLTTSIHLSPYIPLQKMDTTVSTSEYFVLTISELSASTNYTYTINGSNTDNEVVYHEEGTFRTEDEQQLPSSIEVPTVNGKCQNDKIIKGGQLLIKHNNHLYNITGIRVE